MVVIADGDACRVEVKLVRNEQSGFGYDLTVSVDDQTVTRVNGLEYLTVELDGVPPVELQLSDVDNQPR